MASTAKTPVSGGETGASQTMPFALVCNVVIVHKSQLSTNAIIATNANWHLQFVNNCVNCYL